MQKSTNKVVKKLLYPIEKFMELETSGGVLLLIVTFVAMSWANSPWKESYKHLIHLPITIGIGSLRLSHSLHFWVNDALMVIFFFVVGLEIKRELLIGELSSPKKAALPIFAAIGGMIVPALIYHAFNANGPGVHGWGIPMATDIAFAVGVITLLGTRVPFSLKVFLLALAIVDDLGAVLVIAFFYTETIIPEALGFAAFGLMAMFMMRYAGIRKHLPYIITGIFVWFCIFKSGVHATVSGVLIGLLTPLTPLYPFKELSEKISTTASLLAEELRRLPENTPSLNSPSKSLLTKLYHYSIEAQNPLDRSIKVLHPWVTFFIMPLFALVNAGVDLSEVSLNSIMSSPISIGVFLGLLLGKPIGVLLASFISVKAKIASLPQNVNWTQMSALGFLAGIGFTMALFISNLALKTPHLEAFSKIGILLASLLASIVGASIFYLIPSSTKKE
ncbi:MAG: Na+/H+ antiporter NhaA [Bdellovibrio sp.]|nr:MAG: Na+/H+ antiporter NhaA [Bdellovibrio sp.]